MCRAPVDPMPLPRSPPCVQLQVASSHDGAARVATRRSLQRGAAPPTVQATRRSVWVAGDRSSHRCTAERSSRRGVRRFRRALRTRHRCALPQPAPPRVRGGRGAHGAHRPNPLPRLIARRATNRRARRARSAQRRRPRRRGDARVRRRARRGRRPSRSAATRWRKAGRRAVATRSRRRHRRHSPLRCVPRCGPAVPVRPRGKRGWREARRRAPAPCDSRCWYRKRIHFPRCP